MIPHFKRLYFYLILNYIDPMITQEKLKKLLHYDPETGVFCWRINTRKKHKKGDLAGNIYGKGPVIICINSRPYPAHRLAWLYVYGYMPEGIVDHIDRCNYHNWIDNLREGTQTCNMRNKGLRADNASGVSGVRKCNKYWLSHIGIANKNHKLGTFENFVEAVAHRFAAEQCIGGFLNSTAELYMRGLK